MRLDRLLLVFAVATAAITAILVIYVHVAIGIPKDDPPRLDYFKSMIELLKVMLISFFAAIAVVILKDIFQERKYEFENKTKAKQLYTEAKTRIDYLPYRFQFMDDTDEIFKEIENLHQVKHLAETYHQYLPVKNKNAKGPEQRIWTADPYDKLNNLTTIIQEHSQHWHEMRESKRFNKMIEAYPEKNIVSIKHFTMNKQEYQEQQKFEHELINRRLTWLLTSQTIFFAALAFAIGNNNPGIINVPFLYIISSLGIAVSVLIFIGIYMGIRAKRQNWKDAQNAGVESEWGVRTTITRVALIPDLCLPVIFVIAWIFVLITMA